MTDNRFDEETEERMAQAAMRILDHVMTATLLGDDFVPYDMPSATDDTLTFAGVFRDQRDHWPTAYPGWKPLTEEEFSEVWRGARMMLMSG